jgi:hypothetical protein
MAGKVNDCPAPLEAEDLVVRPEHGFADNWSRCRKPPGRKAVLLTIATAKPERCRLRAPW